MHYKINFTKEGLHWFLVVGQWNLTDILSSFSIYQYTILEIIWTRSLLSITKILLFYIQRNTTFLASFKNLFKMLNMFRSLLWIYNNIVQIGYYTMIDKTSKINVHSSLKISSNINQYERHSFICEGSPFILKCSFQHVLINN